MTKRKSAPVMPELPPNTMRRLEASYQSGCSVCDCPRPGVYVEYGYFLNMQEAHVAFYSYCEVHGWLLLRQGTVEPEPGLLVQLPLFVWWCEEDVKTRGLASIRIGAE